MALSTDVSVRLATMDPANFVRTAGPRGATCARAHALAIRVYFRTVRTVRLPTRTVLRPVLTTLH
jgi:hypothetical protein